MRFAVQTIAVCLIAAPTFAQAPSPKPRADYHDEGAVIEQSKTLFYFEADGTGRRDVYVKLRAESESGVQQWGQVIAGYNAANESLELPLVRVTKPDGTVIDTPATAVQDLTSQVQRVAPVYTDFREKHVTVESFRPGDTLEVRMITTIREPLARGQFWGDYNFADSGIVLDEQLDLDVPSSRQLIVRSRPGLEPAMTEAPGRRKYHWASSHKEREDPDKKTDDDEDADPKPPAVRFTSFSDWRQVGEWFAALEKAARIVTPEVRAKAQELTAGKATDLEKLEALYNYVSANFRYVSLSLGAGRYQPRAAGDVMSTQYGDCKDKHTLFASLIDAAGLHASAVLINPMIKLDPDFPSPSQFNHVITRAMAGTTAVWVDTTEEVAPFRMLPSSLRDKQALLVDGTGSRLERTPALNAEPSRSSADVTGKIDERGALTARIQMSLRGDIELVMRAAFRAVPQAQWKQMVDRLAEQWRLPGKVTDFHVSDPIATKAPFTFDLTVADPSYVTWGASHIDADLPMQAFSSGAQMPNEESKAPVKLGDVGSITYSVRLELPSGATPSLPLPVSIERDYGSYAASYRVDGHSLVVTRTTTSRQSELPASRRSDYAAFLRVLNADGKQRLSLTSTIAASPGAAAETDIKELYNSGYQALRARDYEKASIDLARVVEKDPKHRTAWMSLGNAYFGLRRYDQAIAAFQKQVELNPFDGHAYDGLGLAYAAQKRYDEAARAFLKQIEINPLDTSAHSGLGVIYLEQKRYDAAAEELEKAASTTPDSAALQTQLGRAYLNAGKNEAASAAFDKAVSLSPSPGTWNSIAYELSLHAMDLDRAQRYAESAIAMEAAASRNVDLAHVDARALAIPGDLSAFWDTLGWIYFAKGDLARAEKFVAAAWAIDQRAEIGDHRGQIFDKQGRRDDAIHAYAAALSAEQPVPETRQHLAALVGDASVDGLKTQHQGDLLAARTLALKPDKQAAGKHAEFFVLIGQPGRVEAATFIEGDEQLRPMTSSLQLMPVVNVFPDDQPARIIRRGIAACGPDGQCTFTLLLPQDARPPKK